MFEVRLKGVVINVMVNKRYLMLSRNRSRKRIICSSSFFIRPEVTRRINISATSVAARDKYTKCWLATSNGRRVGRVTGQDGWHRGIKTCRMDVGDLSGPAGLVGSGSISIATGVGIIANATSATPGWWTPTSTITSAAANTDVVSFLFFIDY